MRQKPHIDQSCKVLGVGPTRTPHLHQLVVLEERTPEHVLLVAWIAGRANAVIVFQAFSCFPFFTLRFISLELQFLILEELAPDHVLFVCWMVGVTNVTLVWLVDIDWVLDWWHAVPEWLHL